MSTPAFREMTQEELQSEEARSRMVAIVSMFTVAAYMAAFLFTYLTQRGQPDSPNFAERLLQLDAHKGTLILSFFFLSIGSLLLASMLCHLMLAVKSRDAALSKFVMILPVVGPALLAIAFPTFALAQVNVAGDFADMANKSVAAAEELGKGGFYQVSQGFLVIAAFIMGLAWVFTCHHAMRVGLLTRLLGIVGMVIGLATALNPQFSIFIQIFWIGALAIVLLSKGETRPPAWVLGRAVPWSEVQAMGEEIRAEAAAREEQSSGD